MNIHERIAHKPEDMVRTIVEENVNIERHVTAIDNQFPIYDLTPTEIGNIMLDLDEELHVKVPMEEFGKFNTVSDLVGYVNKLLH